MPNRHLFFFAHVPVVQRDDFCIVVWANDYSVPLSGQSERMHHPKT